MSDIERIPLYTFTFENGFYSTDPTMYPQGTMVDGSYNMILTETGTLKIFNGIQFYGTGGRSLFNIANGYASLNDSGSAQGVGSIFNYLNESLMAIGSGRIYLYGTNSGINATSTLQIAPKVGNYTYPNWYAAGFPQPSAPTVRARNPVSPFIGKNTGTYSFKIAAVRSATGGRSIASTTSAIIKLQNQTVHLSFPSPFTNGQDRWAIFGTKAGFGGVGVHYLIKEINVTDLSTIDGIPNSYVLEYDDSDLLPITAYIDDYPPSAGKFAARLDNYVLIFGVYTNAIQVSLRNFPESYHPEHIGFLPKAPTAILQDPQNRFIYVATPTSVHMVSVVPSAGNPLVVQTLWSDLGIAHQHAWCSVGGVLFAFTENTGPVTMGQDGLPDSQFATPVINIMRNWLASETVVHYIPHLNAVAYTNQRKTYLFNLRNFKWSSPTDIGTFVAGNIVSAMVLDRNAYICVQETPTNDFNLYKYDANNFPGDVQFTLKTPYVAPNFPNRVNVLGLSSVYTGDINSKTFELLTDYSNSASKSVIFPASGTISSQYTRWHIPRVYNFAVRVSGNAQALAGFHIQSITVYGTTEASAKEFL